VTKPAELRELSAEELVSRRDDARRELFNLRFQAVTGQLENAARLGELRREVARISTILREWELESEEAR
jgi:large subunit ribosomal protein L29